MSSLRRVTVMRSFFTGRLKVQPRSCSTSLATSSASRTSASPRGGAAAAPCGRGADARAGRRQERGDRERARRRRGHRTARLGAAARTASAGGPVGRAPGAAEVPTDERGDGVEGHSTAASSRLSASRSNCWISFGLALEAPRAQRALRRAVVHQEVLVQVAAEERLQLRERDGRQRAGRRGGRHLAGDHRDIVAADAVPDHKLMFTLRIAGPRTGPLAPVHPCPPPVSRVAPIRDPRLPLWRRPTTAAGARATEHASRAASHRRQPGAAGSDVPGGERCQADWLTRIPPAEATGSARSSASEGGRPRRPAAPGAVARGHRRWNRKLGVGKSGPQASSLA